MRRIEHTYSDDIETEHILIIFSLIVQYSYETTKKQKKTPPMNLGETRTGRFKKESGNVFRFVRVHDGTCLDRVSSRGGIHSLLSDSSQALRFTSYSIFVVLGRT